jgi:soluble lytic murein transglycosylase
MPVRLVAHALAFALVTTSSGLAVAQGLVQRDEAGAWWFDEGALDAPWRAEDPDESALLAVDDVGAADAPFWIERLGAARSGAAAELLALASLHRRDAFDAAVRERLGVAAPDAAADVTGEASDRAPRPSPLERALAAYRRGDDADAREALRAILADGDSDLETRCEAWVALGRAEERTGSDARAEEAYEAALAACPADSDPTLRALFGLGRACALSGSRRCAEEHLRRIQRDFPDSTYVDDALFYLAEVHRGRRDEAEAAVVEECLSLAADGDMWREAVFRRLRPCLDDPARHGDAIALIERAIAQFERDETYYSQGRFEYVLGDLELTAGHPDRAAATWRAGMERYPLTFYARRMCERLDAAGLGCTWPARPAAPHGIAEVAPAPPALLPLGSCTRPDGAWVDLAQRGELAASAEALLAEIEADPCPEALWIAATLYDRAGDHRHAHDIPRRRITGWDGDLAPSALRRWQVAYPRPHLDLVLAEAERTGVEPALIYAIMREESAFLTGVHSYAGAQGLMQLMPATARGHAEDVRGEVTIERLWEPDVNIRIGANFLEHLGRHFDQNPVLMAAAYNAGRGRVNGWLRERPVDDLALWVEAIPPRQTRDYTKRVMGSLERYRYLYEWPSPH